MNYRFLFLMVLCSSHLHSAKTFIEKMRHLAVNLEAREGQHFFIIRSNGSSFSQTRSEEVSHALNVVVDPVDKKVFVGAVYGSDLKTVLARDLTIFGRIDNPWWGVMSIN